MRWFFTWEFIRLLPERLVFWTIFGFEQLIWKNLIRFGQWLRQINPVKGIKWDSSSSPKWIKSTTKGMRQVLGFVCGIALCLIAAVVGLSLLIGFLFLFCGLVYGVIAWLDPQSTGPEFDRFRIFFLYDMGFVILAARLVMAGARVSKVWNLRHKTLIIGHEQVKGDASTVDNVFMYVKTPNMEPYNKIFSFPACPFRHLTNRFETGGYSRLWNWSLEIEYRKEFAEPKIDAYYWLVSRDSEKILMGTNRLTPGGIDLMSALIRTDAGSLVYLATQQQDREEAVREAELVRTNFLRKALEELRDYYGPEFKTNQRDRKVHDELCRLLERFESHRFDPANDGLDFSRLDKLRKVKIPTTAAG